MYVKAVRDLSLVDAKMILMPFKTRFKVKAFLLSVILLHLVSEVRADGWGTDESWSQIFRMIGIGAWSIVYFILILVAGFRKTNFLRILSCIGIVLYGQVAIFEMEYFIRFPYELDRIGKEIYHANSIWIVYYSLFIAGLLANIIYLLTGNSQKQIRTTT